jgi:hypothetical protein
LFRTLRSSGQALRRSIFFWAWLTCDAPPALVVGQGVAQEPELQVRGTLDPGAKPLAQCARGKPAPGAPKTKSAGRPVLQNRARIQAPHARSVGGTRQLQGRFAPWAEAQGLPSPTHSGRFTRRLKPPPPKENYSKLLGHYTRAKTDGKPSHFGNPPKPLAVPSRPTSSSDILRGAYYK